MWFKQKGAWKRGKYFLFRNAYFCCSCCSVGLPEVAVQNSLFWSAGRRLTK